MNEDSDLIMDLLRSYRSELDYAINQNAADGFDSPFRWGQLSRVNAEIARRIQQGPTYGVTGERYWL